MGRGLSQDLRDRVVAAIDGGMSCRGAAVRFGVSAASAIRWRQLSLRHGTPAAKAQGGDRRSGRIEAHAAFILGAIETRAVSGRRESRGFPRVQFSDSGFMLMKEVGMDGSRAFTGSS